MNRRVRPSTRHLAGTVCTALAMLCACASTSVSRTTTLVLERGTVAVAARAERGATGDLIVLSLDGRAVASARFDAESSPELTLHAEHLGERIESHCTHRWRPGLHIAYRCRVSAASGHSVELAF